MYILLQLLTAGSVYLLGYTTLHLHMPLASVLRCIRIFLQLLTASFTHLLGHMTLQSHMCGSTVTRRHPGLVLLV